MTGLVVKTDLGLVRGLASEGVHSFRGIPFAASGEPGWPRFDAEHRRTRLWDTPPADAAYPLSGLYRLWPPPS